MDHVDTKRKTKKDASENLMPYCSLCNMEYGSAVKSCTLSHCVACGSTRIWSEQTRSINPLGIATVFVFFVLIFTSLFYTLPTSVYFFMGMFGILMGWTIQDAFSKHIIHLCLNCYAKGFSPLKNVKLQNESIKRNMEQFTPIDPEKIKNLLTIQPSGDSKLNFGNTMLIVGLAIATIGIIFGKVIQEYIEAMINP